MTDFAKALDERVPAAEWAAMAEVAGVSPDVLREKLLAGFASRGKPLADRLQAPIIIVDPQVYTFRLDFLGVITLDGRLAVTPGPDGTFSAVLTLTLSLFGSQVWSNSYVIAVDETGITVAIDLALVRASLNFALVPNGEGQVCLRIRGSIGYWDITIWDWRDTGVEAVPFCFGIR